MVYIRNFSIIAHIDHGKSTVADRMIQYILSEKEIVQGEELRQMLPIRPTEASATEQRFYSLVFDKESKES